WLNRFLKEDESTIEMAAKPLLDPRQLRVFEQIPIDERVTTIHETFIPKVDQGKVKLDSKINIHHLIRDFKERTFRGWPKHPGPLNVKIAAAKNATDNTTQDALTIDYSSQEPYRLTMYFLEGSG